MCGLQSLHKDRLNPFAVNSSALENIWLYLSENQNSPLLFCIFFDGFSPKSLSGSQNLQLIL